MQRELVDQVQRGNLVCIGVQIFLQSGAGPQPLRRFLFQKSEIDWERSTVTAFGRKYEEVKVVHFEDMIDSELPQTDLLQSRPHQNMGRRPDLMKALVEIVHLLAEENRFEGLLRKQQVALVQSKAQERYPHRKPPARNTVLEALKRAGFSRTEA